MKKNCNKVVLSLSGGLDSSCLALFYLAKGKELRTYSFDYGQKHRVELEKVQKNVKFLQDKGLPITHQIINLVDVFSNNTSSLVASTGKDIPHGHYASDNMKSTVVPLRNVIFSSIVYSKAINWAVESGEDVIISLGLHAGDHTIYPDCRPESQEACRKAFEISDWNSDKVSYEAPFVNIDKAMVLDEGLGAMDKMGWTEEEINEFLANTHTCYDPDEQGRACGKCGSCTERLEAFKMNGMVDPAEYQKDTETEDEGLDLVATLVTKFIKEFDLIPIKEGSDEAIKNIISGLIKDYLV